MTPGEVGGQRRAGALVVAEHQHPHPLGQVAVLGGDDLDDALRSSTRPRQHPVDRAAAAPDAPLGPLVADGRQRAPYRLDDLPRPRDSPVLVRRPVSQSSTSSTQSSAVGAEPVLLVHPGAAGQPDHADVVQPQHGAAHVRLVLDQREPRRPAGHEPGVQPLQERHRAECRVGELGDQLREPLRLLVQPVVLARRRGGQPGQLDERREVARPGRPPGSRRGRAAHRTARRPAAPGRPSAPRAGSR